MINILPWLSLHLIAVDVKSAQEKSGEFSQDIRDAN
jgi:hypothetical protein